MNIIDEDFLRIDIQGNLMRRPIYLIASYKFNFSCGNLHLCGVVHEIYSSLLEANVSTNRILPAKLKLKTLLSLYHYNLGVRGSVNSITTFLLLLPDGSKSKKKEELKLGIR